MNKFGKLVIIREDEERKGYVICRCDCGKEKSIRKTSLTNKKHPTCSCGCIHKQKASEVGSKTIAKNSKEQILTNMKFNTNFQIIGTEKPPRNNKSGFKGVYFNKSRNKWEAYINIHNRKISLGRYFTIEEAIKVRKEAENKYFKPLLQDLKIIKGV